MIFAKYKLIKETFYPSYLSHGMFLEVYEKKYQLLIFGLIIALSINPSYSFDRGCSDIEGLANKINTWEEEGFDNTCEYIVIL